MPWDDLHAELTELFEELREKSKSPLGPGIRTFRRPVPNAACGHCGGPMVDKLRWKYCSKRCEDYWYTPLSHRVNTCVECGKALPEVVGTRRRYANKRFCSKACTSRGGRKRAYVPKQPPPAACKQCGKSLPEHANNRVRCNRRVYCNAACRSRAFKALRKRSAHP
jgi:hypothetical protein